MIALDSETYPFRPGLVLPRLVCVTAFTGEGEPLLFDRADGLAYVRACLEGSAHLGGAHFPFDLADWCANDPSLLPLVFSKLDRGELHCTHIREALYAIAKGHLFFDPTNGAPIGHYSLGLLAKWYLGLDLDEVKHGEDAWRTRYYELDGVPLADWPKEAADYAKDDARIAWEILQIQEGRENLHDEPAQMRAAFALQLMRSWGVRTDPARVDKFCAEVEEKHVKNRRKFFGLGLLKLATCGKDDTPDEITLDDLGVWRRELVGSVFDPDGRKAIDRSIKAMEKGKRIRFAGDQKTLRSRVTEAYQGNPPLTPPSDKFPEGQVSTSRDTLEQSGDPTLDEFGGSSLIEKLRTTYVPIVRQGTEIPICPEYNVLMETGRISAERPNVTNQPRQGGVRETFVPREGHVYCTVDYNSGEICTLAQVLHTLNEGPTTLGDILRDGQDPHISLGSKLLGSTYDEMKARIDAKDATAKDFRQAAKGGNFGLPGGLGEPKLVLYIRGYGNLCELTQRIPKGDCGKEQTVTWKGRDIVPTCVECLKSAVTLKQEWFNTLPEMSTYFEWVNQEVRESGQIVQLVSERVRGGVSFCSAANSMFQGLLADGAKRALYCVSRECYAVPESPLYGCRPVIFVHDEVITEMPIHLAEKAAERQAEIMVRELQAYCPDVPIKAEPALMWRWLKGAERPKTGPILPCDLCPSCESITFTDWHKAPLAHDEIRAGKKTGKRCGAAEPLKAS